MKLLVLPMFSINIPSSWYGMYVLIGMVSSGLRTPNHLFAEDFISYGLAANFY